MYTVVPEKKEVFEADAESRVSPLPATFSYSDARAAGLSKRALYRLRDEGSIEVIGRGLYRRSDAALADLGLLSVAARSPLATLCLATALARHGLSDAIPPAPDVALPRGTRAPATEAMIQWHFFARDTFDIGRGVLALDQETAIGLYSAERSIIDAFRTRGTQGHELANEALRRWLRRPKTQPSELLLLAHQFPRAEEPLRTSLELLL